MKLYLGSIVLLLWGWLGVSADCSVSGYQAFNCTTEELYFADLRISSEFNVGLQTIIFVGNNFTFSNGSVFQFNFILPATFGQMKLLDQDYWLNLKNSSFTATVDASYLNEITLPSGYEMITFSAPFFSVRNRAFIPFSTVVQNVPQGVTCRNVSTDYEMDENFFGTFGVDLRCWKTIDPLYVFIRFTGQIPSREQLTRLQTYLQDALGAGPRLTIEVSESVNDSYVVQVTITTPYLYEKTSQEVQQELLRRLTEDSTFLANLKSYLPSNSSVVASSDDPENLKVSAGFTHAIEWVFLSCSLALFL